MMRVNNMVAHDYEVTGNNKHGIGAKQVPSFYSMLLGEVNFGKKNKEVLSSVNKFHPGMLLPSVFENFGMF